jgi:hypothetical protein
MAGLIWLWQQVTGPLPDLLQIIGGPGKQKPKRQQLRVTATGFASGSTTITALPARLIAPSAQCINQAQTTARPGVISSLSASTRSSATITARPGVLVSSCSAPPEGDDALALALLLS